MAKKGLLVSFLRDASGSDCTMGGVSSRYTRAVLVGEGVPEIFEPNEAKGCPVIYLEKGPYGDLIARPEPGPNGKTIPSGKWWMFGGNFCYCSDSRSPSKAPIPVHDRYEPPQVTRYLSE